MSGAALLQYRLKSGDPVFLQPVAGTTEPEDKRPMGLIWPAQEKISDSVIQTSKQFQDIHGYKLGDKVQLIKYNEVVPNADELVGNFDAVAGNEPLNPTDEAGWSWWLEYPLCQFSQSFEKPGTDGFSKDGVYLARPES
jgi:hypothetical protein